MGWTPTTASGPEEADVEPDLEVVQIRRGESFKAWSHGYPFHTVCWHFHPEYELHLVVAATGHYFIGEFEPGNLVLTGPSLPHNWVSDIPKNSSIPLRGRIVQFSESFTGRQLSPLMEELMQAQGVRCIELFMMIGGLLSRAPGISTVAFSRAFRRHTGITLVQYVTRLRINLACQILMSDEQAAITDICFEVGFNKLSNFNRQFLAEKLMTQPRFRRLLVDNTITAKAA